MLHYVHYKLIWSVLQHPCYKNKEKKQLKVYKMKQLVNSYCQQVSQKVMLELSGTDDMDGCGWQHRVRNTTESDLFITYLLPTAFITYLSPV